MPVCHNCGAQVAQNAGTCPTCGIQLEQSRGGNDHVQQPGQPQGSDGGRRRNQPQQGQPQQAQPQGQPRGQPQGVGGHQPQQGPAGNHGQAPGSYGRGGHQRSQNAPTKSKISAGIFVLFSIGFALFGILFVAVADMVNDYPTYVAGDLGSISIAFALILFLLAAIDFALGYGIWHVRQWGWYGGMIVAVLSTILWIFGFVDDPSAGSLIFLVLAAFPVYALWDDRRFFGVNI